MSVEKQYKKLTMFFDDRGKVDKSYASLIKGVVVACLTKNTNKIITLTYI